MSGPYTCSPLPSKEGIFFVLSCEALWACKATMSRVKSRRDGIIHSCEAALTRQQQPPLHVPKAPYTPVGPSTARQRPYTLRSSLQRRHCRPYTALPPLLSRKIACQPPCRMKNFRLQKYFSQIRPYFSKVYNILWVRRLAV